MKQTDIDFIVVGVQKGGTTSLHRYLSAHPEIFMPENKELDYFSNDSNYTKGIKYYLSLFSNAQDGESVKGEASPQYMLYDNVPERISSDMPDVKIIMCLRNPIDRAFSQYRMSKRRGIEKRTFCEAVDQQLIDRPANDDELFKVKDTEYLAPGEYGRIYTNFLKHFSRENITIIYSDDLLNNKEETLKIILSFLGLDFSIPLDILDKEYHIGGKQRIPGAFLWLKKASKKHTTLKRIIFLLFKRNTIHSLLHKFETEWNMTEKSNADINADTRNKLKSYYYNDIQLLEKITQTTIPWKEFK